MIQVFILLLIVHILVCSLDHPPTGRRLEVLTTEPGMHLYTGCNTIPHTKGKDGAVYEPFCSVCLETQHYPDTPTHQVYGETDRQTDRRTDTYGQIDR